MFLDLGGLFVSPLRPPSDRPVATLTADNARSGGAVNRQISGDLSKRLVGLP